MNWRKLNRVLHRDLGYFFFGMTIIYALSGIALNHIDDWNPSYVIINKEIQMDSVRDKSDIDRAYARSIAGKFDSQTNFKNFYFPEANQVKIFIDNGNILINLDTGKGTLEKTERRPVFYQVNFLHYNPNEWWTLFADIYAVGLIIIAITGLFILKGKKGIKGRGAWLTASGVLAPLLFLIFS